MSRCFPFPPPGYEKKARSNVDELIKEKHKEKKHKKEKRDKEKREGKEKKDRDRSKEKSKEKHKEKKDRKEKHKDKKKDKVTNRTSNERTTEEKTNGHSEEKVGENSRELEDVRYLKLTEELGRRINDDSGGDQMVEKVTGNIHRRFEAMGSPMEKEKSEMEFGRRIRNGGGAEIQYAKNFTCKVETKIEGMGFTTEMERETGNEMSHYCMDKDQSRIGGIGSGTDNGTALDDRMLQKFSTEQSKIHGSVQPMEKNKKKRIEGKDKTNGREGVDKVRTADRHKDRDREKKSKGKNKDRDKEKDNKREKSEHKHNEGDKQLKSAKKEQLDSLILRPSIAPKSSASGDVNHKRKVINGFVHENDMRPNKVPRPNSFSHLPMENGRKLDPCSINIPCVVFDGHEAMNNLKVERQPDDKTLKFNGTIDAAKTSVPSGHLLIGTSENGESSSKSPHPDSKYLSQIYTVPKTEELPESDEQEWLFGNDNLQQIPKTKSEADEVPRVWGEAVQIESADVLALPYVIPY